MSAPLWLNNPARGALESPDSPNQKCGESGESGESALQPQRTPSESEVSPAESEVSLGESEVSLGESEVSFGEFLPSPLQSPTHLNRWDRWAPARLGQSVETAKTAAIQTISTRSAQNLRPFKQFGCDPAKAPLFKQINREKVLRPRAAA